MRRLAVLLSLCCLPLSASVAHAQRVDPGGGDDEPAGLVPGADEQALLAVAGPRARVRRDAEGRVRLLWGARVPAWSGDPARDAIAFTQRFGDALGIPQGADLRVERTDVWHGLTIVRLRRYAQEHPVIGAQVVVRFLGDGTLEMVLAHPGPAHVEPGARTSATRATELARQLQPGFAITGTTEPLAAGLVVGDTIVPVWSIDLHGAAPSQRGRALLDARDGRLLAIVPLVVDGTGRVYATNPTTTMGETSDVELVDLATPGERLTGTYFDVRSCDTQPGGGCAGRQYAAADAEGNFLYEPEAGAFDDAFAEVNAYHHLSVAAAYHRERNGFTWTCAGGTRMRIFTNYTEAPGVAYDNAAFSPASGGQCGYLLFGQGPSGDFAYDADVVSHEFGHAVTDQVASIVGFLSDPLGVSYEPLAVNEGTSDYYAGAIQGDPNIAESFSGVGGLGGGEGSLRVIDNDLTCPDALFGEGHFDGRLWGGLGWDLRDLIGADAADELVFTTVASITENPSLAEAGDLLVATADAMVATGALSEAEAAMVQSAVAARGLPECQRVVPLDDGEVRQGWSGSEFLTGGVGRSVAPLHYRIDVPADATRLTIAVTNVTFTGQYTLHFRNDLPVRVSLARIGAAGSMPVSGGPVVLDESSAFPLPRCTTLHVALEATDLRTRGQSVYQIQATLERSGDSSAECPAPPPDAGAPVADGGVDGDGGTASSGGGGCGCRVGERRSSAGGLAVMLALGTAVALRRRRR